MRPSPPNPMNPSHDPIGLNETGMTRSNSMARGERFLRTSEVAQKLHVSPKTVSRWAKEGRLPFLSTLGGHRRFPASEIDRLTEELAQAPHTQAG
jgi:excisionase family DNA binding protein